MRLNWLAYNYRGFDGFGRYSTYVIQALERAGVEVHPHFEESIEAPRWMQERWGMALTGQAWDGLTISCLPPYFLRKAPGRHWLLTMTEGSELPRGWGDIINKSGVERVIVPCQHNAETFRSGGVEAPIHVIPGGTDPDDFPLLQRERDPSHPYIFLTLADRGNRKGWTEAYQSFYSAFGGKTTGNQDVRLIIKCRPDGNDLVDLIRTATDADARIVYQVEDAPNVADVYAQADCVVLPSRSEGWGMPHREAAMMGLPVITQAYSGMDDGHTHEWALVIEGGRMEPIPKQDHIAGEWRRVDVDELADMMRLLYDCPEMGERHGTLAAAWLRMNQSWDHASSRLIVLMQEHGALEPEGAYAWH